MVRVVRRFRKNDGMHHHRRIAEDVRQTLLSDDVKAAWVLRNMPRLFVFDGMAGCELAGCIWMTDIR